jgi:hypothetical protein
MAEQFPEIVVRDYGSLVDALRAAKEHLQISNETLEALAGLCHGHADKLLGSGQQKRIGPIVLGLLCEALGVEFVMRPNMAAVHKLAHRWEKRNSSQVRVSQRTVSQAALDRCRPVILRELTRNATIASANARRRRQAQRHSNGYARP